MQDRAKRLLQEAKEQAEALVAKAAAEAEALLARAKAQSKAENSEEEEGNAKALRHGLCRSSLTAEVLWLSTLTGKKRLFLNRPELRP